MSLSFSTLFESQLSLEVLILRISMERVDSVW